MTRIGPLNEVPIACTLTPSAGRQQVERWCAFDDAYLLDVEHGESRLAVRYARTEDSVQQLRELVAVESACCSFVEWDIDESQDELRLVVTGTPEQLAALNIG